MLKNMAIFLTKREKIRPIVIIVSGAREEKPCCPKIFVWDCTTNTRPTLGARVSTLSLECITFDNSQHKDNGHF